MGRSERLIERQLAEQRAWMENHGGNLAGYQEAYGHSDDPEARLSTSQTFPCSTTSFTARSGWG